MQAFIVSVIAGCLFPILPIIAELGLTNSVQSETLAVTGIVYAAAVGMASRNQAIAFSSFFCATMCAVIYGAEKYKAQMHEGMLFIKYGAVISGGIMLIYALSYLIERFTRHYIEHEAVSGVLAMSRTLKERFLFLGDFEWREWLTSNLVAMFFVTVVVTGGIVLLMYVFALPSSPWALGTLLVIDVVGVVLVGSVTVDMVKRYEAKHQLAALLSSTNEEHWSYLRDTYVDDRYPHFIIHHFDSRASRAPEFDEEWFNVWAFLHSDPYGTAASQALFQRSPVGRRRYFNEVKEMARRYRAP